MACSDCEKQSDRIKDAFKDMFPLAGELDLPWHVSHIKEFLEKRIKLEFEERTRHFTTQVCRVLCEVSPPKAHLVDMARIVTDLAKTARAYKEAKESLYLENGKHIEQLEEAKSQLAKLGKQYNELSERHDKLVKEVENYGKRIIAEQSQQGESDAVPQG